jgi:2-keto-4-pentenoate hydratase/2-oxohepta-3-ene-1,7-dioic acid hydratase in catechol pathway
MQQLFVRTLNPSAPKIIGVGKNYLKHVKEMSHTDGHTDMPKEPVIFTKALSSILPKGKDPVFPKHGRIIDHEVELGIMIAKKGKNIKKADWEQYVGG